MRIVTVEIDTVILYNNKNLIIIILRR